MTLAATRASSFSLISSACVSYMSGGLSFNQWINQASTMTQSQVYAVRIELQNSILRLFVDGTLVSLTITLSIVSGTATSVRC